jgi:hypothetical protein
MRLFAKSRLVLIFTLIFLCNVSQAGAANCECPSPPGGIVKCENNQVAICEIRDGKVNAQCKTPPKGKTRGSALRAWLLSEFLKRPVEVAEYESNAELQRIILSGQYKNPKTGEIIKFSLPEEQ